MAKKCIDVADLERRAPSPTVASMIGKTYNSLTVTSYAGSRGERPYVHCVCECGQPYLAMAFHIHYGRIQSCGCRRKDLISRNNIDHGFAPLSGKRKRVYNIWRAMRERCNRPGNVAYKHYGGRGIRVCERWQSFQAFLDDMGEPPEGTSIDRIDNDGDYCPENCRWATDAEQSVNQRTNWHVTLNGVKMTASEAMKLLGWKGTRLYKFLYRSGASKNDFVPIDEYVKSFE